MHEAPSQVDEAVEEWLNAYDGYRRYLTATESLFGVFAQSWQGSRHHIAEAFTDFRETLLKEHGLKHLDVVTAFPRQRTESK
jgi:hypothetical protein